MSQQTHSCAVVRSEAGFVLIAVLAVLVILSILAATIGAITQRLRDEQLERQRQFRAQLAMDSTRATAIYLLSTQRMTYGGLTVDDRVVMTEDEQQDQQTGDSQVTLLPVGNELAMDGSVHRGMDGALLALQDDRGLLAVNWATSAELENYLGPDPKREPIATMINLLQDYQDADDLYRLNSAERQEYLRQKRPPPTNRTLMTPMELRRVQGWDKAIERIGDVELNDTLSVGRSTNINVNTAPLRVLRTLPGVDLATAQRVVAMRTLSPFIDLSVAYQVLGSLPVDEDLLSLYPAGSGTLKLWSAEGGTVQVLHWTLTPWADGGRPWREDYEFILPGNESTTQTLARPVAAKVFAEPDVPAK